MARIVWQLTQSVEVSWAVMKYTYADVIARYLSWPAVSQIWALIVFPSTCMLLVANSTPIVDFDSKLNSFRVNLDSRLLFPTPESPIRTTGTIKNQENYIFRSILVTDITRISNSLLSHVSLSVIILVMQVNLVFRVGLNTRSSAELFTDLCSSVSTWQA